MQISTVNRDTMNKRKDGRGRPTKYKEIYDKARALPSDKAVEIECDTPEDTARLYSAVSNRKGFSVSKRGETIWVTHIK